MKEIIAIIEKADDGGYSIYSKGIKGVYGYGLSMQEAKDDFKEVYEEQAEYYKEKYGEFPKWYFENPKIEYRYDFSAFFEAFPFINVTQFAHEVGINPSLMRKYKGRLAFASDKQKQAIQSKFNELVDRMNVVRF